MCKKLSFKFIFGVKPSIDKYDQPVHKFGQRAVDIKLVQLAEAFLTECHYEQSLNNAEGDSTKEIAKNLRSWRRQHKYTIATKRRFWRAHALAANFDYEVKEHARDYMGNNNAHLKAIQE